MSIAMVTSMPKLIRLAAELAHFLSYLTADLDLVGTLQPPLLDLDVTAVCGCFHKLQIDCFKICFAKDMYFLKKQKKLSWDSIESQGSSKRRRWSWQEQMEAGL